MNAGLWNFTLGELRDQTASARPTPGGGAACVVSGTLGLGLVLMALAITRKRTEAGSEADVLDALLQGGHSLMEALGAVADADMQAFRGYLAARALPEHSEQESATKGAAEQHAAQVAAEVPLEGARLALRGLALAHDAAALASTHVLSDVLAGAELLSAAVAGLLHTVDSNLRTLAERDAGGALRDERSELARSASNVCKALRARAAERLDEHSA